MHIEPSTYDEQARVFDKRAGLSDEVARKVAGAVLDYGGYVDGNSILEIGAGTGEIGYWLCSNVSGYTGIDYSDQMLDNFRARLKPNHTATLIHSDANHRWPVKNASTSLVFGSRVLHLLDIEHVLMETLRTGTSDGVVLIMGRVKRPKNSPKSRMREKMRELLQQQGLVPRATDQLRKKLINRAIELGGEVLATLEADSWTRNIRPIDSINGWRGKNTMGGIIPADEVKEKILAQLYEWGTDIYGDMTRDIPSVEKYQLDGVRFRN